MEYYVLKDKDDKILKSAFVEKKDSLEAKTEEGEKVVKMSYDGCPHWQNKNKLDDFLDG